MNANKFKCVVLVAVAGLFIQVCAIYAQPSDADAAKQKALADKMDARYQSIYKDLHLSDAQKKTLDENRNNQRAQLVPLFKEIKEKSDLMREELQKDKLNTDKINKIHEEIKTIEAQIMDSRLTSILVVRKTLTPEQFKNFMDKIKGGKKHLRNKDIDMA